MALAATTHWEVRTTGDDTNNGGAFDPGQTAGMFTDGAATVATSTIDAATFAAGAINAAAIAADAITDAKVAADVTIASVTGAVGSVTGAVGSVTGNVGGNVVGSVASVTAGVTLAASAVQAIWDALTSALTTVGSIGKLLVDNINATISSRLASVSYTTPPTVGQIADQVWDETLADHLTAGSTGNALNAAGAAGDPWTTALPGAYGAGTAGKIIGDNINATISSRLASASYTAPLDAAGTRTAVGLASANLDTQLDALPTAVEIGAQVTSDHGAGSYVRNTEPLDAAGVRAAVGLSAANLDTQIDAVPTATENADALLKRDMSAVSGEAARSPINALRASRNRFGIAGGTLTVFKEDDATPAWTAAVTETPGDPVSEVDPA